MQDMACTFGAKSKGNTAVIVEFVIDERGREQ
jgi:hypothetical protein